MDNNEAKKWMNELHNWNTLIPEAKEACGIAIKALEIMDKLQEVNRVLSELAVQAEKDMGLSENEREVSYDYGRKTAYETGVKLLSEILA